MLSVRGLELEPGRELKQELERALRQELRDGL